MDKIKKMVVWGMMLSSLLIAQQMEVKWIFKAIGGGYNSATAIVYGGDRYIYAGGTVSLSVTRVEQYVMCLTSESGQLVSTFITGYGGRLGGLDEITYGGGSVYMVGTTGVEGSPFPWTSMTVARAWGWQNQYDWTTQDEGESIVYGDDGNIYACGYGLRLYTNQPPQMAAFVVSYTSGGSYRWSYVYDPYQTNGGFAYDVVYGDTSVYYCGVHNNYSTVASLSPANGNVRWRYTGSSGAKFLSLVYGLDGNIYAIGDNITSLTPTGNVRWTYSWSGKEIAFGSDSNIYAMRDNQIIKLSTEGQLVWSYTFTGGTLNSMVYGLDGNIYATGERDLDLIVVKINSITGEETARYTYNGPTNGVDRGYDIDYGLDGCIYVAGQTTENNISGPIVIALNNQVNVSERKTAREITVLRAIPNPFMQRTEIRFTNYNSQLLSLKIYDIHGKLVRDFSRATHDGHTMHIVWDGTDDSGRRLPEGIYFITIENSGLTPARVVKIK